MRKIVHIVHPVVVPETSDLRAAQPITFHTMVVAREFARGKVDVKLLAVKYHDEAPEVPGGFRFVPDLERSVGNIRTFENWRKLAVLSDILDRMYEASEGADYLIYTNVDIALQPFFYVAVDRLIQKGHDALIINRRSISDELSELADVPLIYADIGERHPGWDCFVFRREVYKSYVLGDICIGTCFIGLAFLSNVIAWATDFKQLTDLYLTFHLGGMGEWYEARFSDYALHNEQESTRIIEQLLRSPDACPNRAELEQFLRDLAVSRPDMQLLHRMFGITPAPQQTLRRRIARRVSRLLLGPSPGS